MGGGWFNLVARLRLFQPGLARVGAGAELGNIEGIPLRLISGISHSSYSYISGIR